MIQTEIIENRVYYDTIRMQTIATDKILSVLEKSFDYSRIQTFRMKKDTTYVDCMNVNIQDFLNRTSINKDENLSFLKNGQNLYSLDEETGEITDLKPENDNYETRGIYSKFKFAPSSNYEMSITLKYQVSEIPKLNRLEPFLEFEFSIPKFLFGHNLLLYPLYGDTDGLQLNEFIRQFFKICFDEDYRKINIKILRIDCCKNFKFEKKENFELWRMALVYHWNKFDKSRGYSSFQNQTFMYKTNAYSIKFYDKEAEFAKHDLTQIYKIFVNRNKPIIGLKKASEHALKQVSEFQNFSKNIWRLEICLRNAELNNFFWRDWQSRDFKHKEEYSKKITNYKIVRDQSKTFSQYMQKPFFETVNGAIVARNEISFNKYLDILQAKGVLNSRSCALEYYDHRNDYALVPTLDLFKKVVKKEVFEHYRFCEQLMRVRYMRPVKIDSFCLGFREYEISSFWDKKMIKRTFDAQQQFVNIVKLVEGAKKVNMIHYLQVHKNTLEGQKIKMLVSDCEKTVILTKSKINALVRYLSNIKCGVIIPRKTKYNNSILLEAVKAHLHIADEKDFCMDEKFLLNFCYNEKYLYICPIIDSKLSDQFIGTQLYNKFNRL